MNYEPQTRYPNGVDPKVRYQSSVCDVCGKSRAHYKHVKCSKARKAAGFRFVGEKHADTKVKCVQCQGLFAYGSMMGNTCRDCHAATLDRVFGGGEA